MGALLAIASLVVAAGAGAASTLTRGATYHGTEIVPGQVIVSYVAGTSGAERRSTRRSLSGRLAQTLALPRTEVVELPDGTSVEDAIAAFEDDPDVAYAEPNYVYKISALPNDTLFGQLWGLNQVSDNDIDAPEAWDLTTGSASIIVAVIDSGVAYNHPDLAGNIWVNNDPAGGGDQDGNGFVDDTQGWDFIQNDNTPFDANGHGTHVAGTIGARGNNALGVTGVNWQVSIMPLRAGDAAGRLPLLATFNSIVYACANGARVVNGSYGGPNFSQTILNTINSAACANTLFVFAAGNDGSNNDTTPEYPCNYNTTRIICVAATDINDARAGFSNFGATSVDLAAPGVGILSSEPTYTNVLVDSFENTPTAFSTRWAGQTAPGGHPTWGQLTPGAVTGTYMLTDSPTGNYFANTDTHIRALTASSLAGKTGCSLEYYMHLATEAGFDFVTIEASTTFAGTYTDISQGGWSGSPGAFYSLFQLDAAAFDGQANVFLRFRLTSDASNQGDGVHIDDIVFKCLATPVPLGDYQNLDGTSMATPHVAGVAALILALNPGVKPIQARSILLSSVDPVAGLSGVVATGGRLNAHNALTAPVDLTKPNTTITAGPAKRTKSRTATFKFKSTEAGSTFKCKLDKGAFTTCKSPKTYKKLKKGSHTFQVVATDKMGNVDATAAKRTWKVIV